MHIEFFEEDIKWKFKQRRKARAWLERIATECKQEIIHLNYVFCSDVYLLEVNQNYLKQDAYTDVISFDYQNPQGIEGDIFISVERVKENAKALGFSFERELLRVMAHGVLHTMGHKDETRQEKLLMRAAEDECIVRYYL